ncbi:MAG: TIR domain-containing protein [Chloroflexi bacterium]|nr:TIR domain-containing protein [Chloroflexota bacterium]
MAQSLFISYAHLDGEKFAEKLRSRLTMAEHTAFLDRHSIEPGTHWDESITEAIVNADFFVPILTPHSVSSQWCGIELGIALTHEKTIIPLLCQACDIPKDLQKVQYIDFSDGDLFESRFERLMHTISLQRIVPRPNVPWLDYPIKDCAVHYKNKPAQTLRCIKEDTSLARAYAIMYKSDFVFRHLLVTTDGHAGSPLHGILSLRHILKLQTRDVDLRSLSASEVMDPYDPSEDADHFFTVVPDDSTLKTAMQKLSTRLERRNAIGRFFYMSAVPLVDRNGNATGIVSFKDVLRVMQEIANISDFPVSQVMRGVDRISYSKQDETFDEANIALLRYGPGQRDVPVVDDFKQRTLLGLVPDHIFIMNLNSELPIGDFMTKYDRLRVQYLNTPLSQTFSQYLSGNAATIFFSFPVVTSEKKPQLEGLIGYRDIFEFLLPSE